MAILNMASNQNLHTTVQNYYDGKLLMEMEKQLVFYQGGQRLCADALTPGVHLADLNAKSSDGMILRGIFALIDGVPGRIFKIAVQKIGGDQADMPPIHLDLEAPAYGILGHGGHDFHHVPT